MNIIIVGCGKVGEELAHRLNDEGDNITVIDVDSTKVNDVTSRLDVLGVTGNEAHALSQPPPEIRGLLPLPVRVLPSDKVLRCCTEGRAHGR